MVSDQKPEETEAAGEHPTGDPAPRGTDVGLLEQARYRVILTDWSTSRAKLKDLIAQHTRIPAGEIDHVLQERPAVLADAATREEAETLLKAFAGSGGNLQAVAREMPGIVEALDDFLINSDATSVLLMDRSGFKICQRGDPSSFDVEKMLGLIAGVFAATKRIASFLGEEEFGALFHPGNRASIHLNLVGDRGVLVTQFDARTTMRVVRLYAADTAGRIGKVL